MPIFRVTVIEEIKQRTVAYVEAPNQTAADAWASNAPDTSFRSIGQVGDTWGEVESIVEVQAPPDGWRVNAAAAAAS